MPGVAIVFRREPLTCGNIPSALVIEASNR
jgi:hypothetical protein